ncbi:MAG: hypothetical protein MJE77_48175 [Proteobacteria bacterium]|nr:hypothetical protein [Pseudomonadota bacterium]
MRKAQIEGQELLARTVVLILAHYVLTGDIEATRRLLEPIDRQQLAIAERCRRRCQPTDVYPDTGEEIGEATIEVVE